MEMSKANLFIFVLVLLIRYAWASRFKRLINGQLVETATQFPFFAQLILPDESLTISLCSASLIHTKWILSAASCFPSNLQDIERIESLGEDGIYTVLMGSHKVNDYSGYLNSIVKLHFHPPLPRKDPRRGVDVLYGIAVGQLKWNYILSIRVDIVFLPSPTKPTDRCKGGWIISIGARSLDGRTKSNVTSYLFVSVKNRLEEIEKPSPTTFYARSKLGANHVTEGDRGALFVCSLDLDDEDEDQVIQYGVVTGVKVIKKTVITFIEDVEKHMSFIQTLVPELKVYRRKHFVGNRKILHPRPAELVLNGVGTLCRFFGFLFLTFIVM